MVMPYIVLIQGRLIKATQTPPLFLGALAEFEHHVQHAVTRQTTLRSFCAMTDRRKGRLNRIAGPDALPVLRREIIEGQVVSRIFRPFVWRWPDPGSCHVGLG